MGQTIDRDRIIHVLAAYGRRTTVKAIAEVQELPIGQVYAILTACDVHEPARAKEEAAKMREDPNYGPTSVSLEIAADAPDPAPEPVAPAPAEPEPIGPEPTAVSEPGPTMADIESLLAAARGNPLTRGLADAILDQLATLETQLSATAEAERALADLMGLVSARVKELETELRRVRAIGTGQDIEEWAAASGQDATSPVGLLAYVERRREQLPAVVLWAAA